MLSSPDTPLMLLIRFAYGLEHRMEILGFRLYLILPDQQSLIQKKVLFIFLQAFFYGCPVG